MTWESYVRGRMGLGDEAVRFSDLYATDLGCDALPATKGWGLGPGFFGVGGQGFKDDDGFLRFGFDASSRFPDGNHSLARHLIKKLMPAALDGDDTMEEVFNGSLHYDRFDRAGDPRPAPSGSRPDPGPGPPGNAGSPGRRRSSR